MTDSLDHAVPPAAAARSAPIRYSRPAMLLHWTIAACFAFQIGLGWRMDAPRGPQTFAIFQLHKSIGITILLLTLVRIAWRLKNPAPAYPATMKPWEKALAHAVHITFYVLLLGLPVTGWLLVSASRTAVPTLLFGTIPWPHVPGIPGLAPDARGAVEAAAEFGHHALIYISYLVLFLHVAGALKHQFLERGGDLARMLPAPSRALGAAAVAAVLALAEIALVALTLPLRPIALTQPAPVPTRSATLAEPAATPASAAPRVPAATPTPAPLATPVASPSAAMPSRWTVRRAASSLGFHTSWSQGQVDGHFGTWDATILFDPGALDASSVKVTIDMASASTGVPDTEGALPGDDWFAAATHPRASFVASTFRHRGGDRYEAIGTLTIRGTSRPLTLPFTLAITDDIATMSGTVVIDRTRFGIGQGEWASTTDVPAGVTVAVTIKADRGR